MELDGFISSSANDSDVEWEIINFAIFDEEDHQCYCPLCRPKVPRIQNYIESVLDLCNDFHFRKHFRNLAEYYRMCRATFDYLLFLVRPDLENMYGRQRISAEKQLYIALWYLSTPDSYRSVISKFGVSDRTAWLAVLRVVTALCKLRSYFIKRPSVEECLATSHRIEAKHGFSGVIGALDGTHICILAPKEDSEAYINRKGFPSMQLQVTCNDNLEFTNCYTGLPGSVHNMRVFKWSGLQQRCTEEYFPNDSHLLGDSAYTLQKHIMVPYRDDGHLTVEQKYCNKKLSSIRMMVECSIGLLKGRWRMLLGKVPMRRTDLIPFFIMAACVLLNICLKAGDTFEFPIVVPETHDTDEPLSVTDEEKAQGQLKRDLI